MKKIIVSMFAVVALGAGLTTVVDAAPAHAASRPYPGTVGARPTFPAPVSRHFKKGTKPKITVGVKQRSGSLSTKPRGTIKVVVKGPYNWTKTVTLTTRGLYTITLPKAAKKGTYHITVSYTPSKGSPFKSFKNLSDGTFRVG